LVKNKTKLYKSSKQEVKTTELFSKTIFWTDLANFLSGHNEDDNYTTPGGIDTIQIHLLNKITGISLKNDDSFNKKHHTPKGRRNCNYTITPDMRQLIVEPGIIPELTVTESKAKRYDCNTQPIFHN